MPMPSNRRDFLGLSAGALAALGFRRLGFHGGAMEKLGPIGVQLYTVRDLLKSDFEGTIAKVAQIGYKEVEFADYFGRTPAQIRQVLHDHGLSAPSTHIGYDVLMKGEWPKAVDTSAAIGHQYMVVAWIDEDQRKTLDGWKKVAERLNGAAEVAKKSGLRMAYHNHSYEFVPLEGKVPYDQLLADTDSSLVWLEMDLYWVTAGGKAPLDYFARWPGRIRLVHIKDSKGPPKHEMTDVGSGVIPWAEILRHHKQAGIEHYFVEHDEPKDALASIAASYRFLRRLEF